MTVRFGTTGICAKAIDVELNGHTVGDVRFYGGCSGYSQAVPALVKGRKVGDVIACLKGIDCAGRGTSCADQLARALEILVSERDKAGRKKITRKTK